MSELYGTAGVKHDTTDTPSIEEMLSLLEKHKVDLNALDERVAESLMEAGFALLPAPWLRPFQIFVSQSLYDAAVRVSKKREQEGDDAD